MSVDVQVGGGGRGLAGIRTQHPGHLRPPSAAMKPSRCIGTCVPVFLVAVLFDAVGLVVLFVGIFANLRAGGLFYGDFLIYSGSLVVFFSLALWLMWYLGNIRLEEEEEEDGEGDPLGPRSSIVDLARKLSEKLSLRMKGGEERAKCIEDGEGERGGTAGTPGTPPPKSGRVTWGRSTAYDNEGYDSSVDPADSETPKDPPDPETTDPEKKLDSI